MPVPHSFARHAVAGEDARAPDSLLSFSPETHDLRTPLSLAYNLHDQSYPHLHPRRNAGGGLTDYSYFTLSCWERDGVRVAGPARVILFPQRKHTRFLGFDILGRLRKYPCGCFFPDRVQAGFQG